VSSGLRVPGAAEALFDLVVATACPAADEGRAVKLRAEVHRPVERRATNCTYRKSEEIGPAWVLVRTSRVACVGRRDEPTRRRGAV